MTISFNNLPLAEKGKHITVKNELLVVPDNPIIPFIEGDGIGPEIMDVTRSVLDSVVESAYNGQKRIHWLEIYAGEKANKLYNNYLPNDTLEAIKYFKVALKGPLNTPIGEGIRSLNVALRKELDLYACVRPVKYIEGTPAPVKYPEKINFVIFRENTEDLYAGIEWQEGSSDAQKVITFLKGNMGINIRSDSGIGIKPISRTASQRLVRRAIQYALNKGAKSVTLVHKGNIMKYTEGAFREWGYQLALEEFKDKLVQEEEIKNLNTENSISKKLIIKDRIADNMFQQILIRPDEYEVIATTNINGDYLSDAAAAQIGGLGMAPGANFGDFIALFEATHGTAPQHAGKDKVNPTSLILSGRMMLEHLGWTQASEILLNAITKTIKEQKVTYDLARLMVGVKPLKCSEFGETIIRNIV